MKFIYLFFLSVGDVKNADHFCYAEETKVAWEAGKLSDDITEEQRKLTQADLVIFQVRAWVTVMCMCFFFFCQAVFI